MGKKKTEKEYEYKHLVINLTEQDLKDLSKLYTQKFLEVIAERKGKVV